MSYYLLDEKNNQLGPFTLDQLKEYGIRRNTKVWCKGMKDWTIAESVKELNDLFDTPPPPGKNTEPPPAYLPHKQYQDRSTPINFTNLPVYDEYFDTKKLTEEEASQFKKNLFFETFNTGVGILLHYLTFGIFTTISCGLKFSKLPQIKQDDFSAGKAIGFLFIPIFNLYWLFVFWRRLVMRINFQFKLRNMHPPISLGLATSICILFVIPYLGFLNYFILLPLLYSQIQNATNKLAEENMQNDNRRRF